MRLTRPLWVNPRQVGRGAPSAPPAGAPPPPGWPPAVRVPLTCRRSVAGCHIFQPGFGKGNADETLSRAGGQGSAVPLYIWGRCPLEVRPGASGRGGVGAGGREQRRRRRARLPATCGHGRAPAVLAQLREDCAAPPGPARSEHARGRRPPESQHPGPPDPAARAGTPEPAALPPPPREPRAGRGPGEGTDWLGRAEPGARGLRLNSGEL